MKNGVAYPLAPEIIEAIEKKRKEFIKRIGVKVSQAKFTNIIAPNLKPSIANLKLNYKLRIKTKIKYRKWN